ncbi:MAG: alpha/beta fold hydrolase [Clostridium sp.]|uniref:alpha/beta fold hydrolase n=1 Tax=Clostridium sp. TaxID=1506 RepID=UPI003D6C97D9
MYIEMSDKVKLYVKKSGQGIPCIFIHGGPGEGSLDFEVLGGNSLESFMQIIYFDQRGSARSGGTSADDYSIERIIDDIEEIRKNLGISKWIVMAHSFGGIIATNYVYKYQNFVHKLILSNTTLNMEDSFKSQIYYGSNLLSKEELQSISYNSNLEKWKYIINVLIEKDIFYKLQYKDYNNFLRVNDVSNQIENFNATMANQAFSNKEYFMNYFDITNEITVPVLVITGNEDYAIGPNHYKKFMFPNKTIKIMQGKHMLYIENNEEFKSVIEEFIDDL